MNRHPTPVPLQRLVLLRDALRGCTPPKPCPNLGALDARRRLMRLIGYDPRNNIRSL